MYVTTPSITDDEGKVKLVATVDNQGDRAESVTVQAEIRELGTEGSTGRTVASSLPVKREIAATASGNVELVASVPKPKRWDLSATHRYVANVIVRRGDELVDSYLQPFGFRTIEFTPRDGFKLNGRRVPLYGTCNHHDLGPLGAALNVRALERQLEILKEMGCNALRTSHNPPAPELLDLADRMGFVVMVEAFDCWKQGKTPVFAALDKNPAFFGEFVWTGFDYLGEPTPYNSDVTNLLNFSDPEKRAAMKEQLEAIGKLRVPSASSYFGIVDLCGFKKDRFYIYQARWRPDLPMAHILPHWNWPERVGQVTPVHVYTSGDEAELFLGGKSLGRKKKGPFEYRLRWDDVVYQPGELSVVAYRDGKEWAGTASRRRANRPRFCSPWIVRPSRPTASTWPSSPSRSRTRRASRSRGPTTWWSSRSRARGGSSRSATETPPAMSRSRPGSGRSSMASAR